MADKRFTPKQLDRSQRDTLTVAGVWAGGDTATVAINEKELTLTVGTLVTTAQVANSIAEMINGTAFTDTTATATETGDEVGEFQEVEATVSGSVVSVTSRTKGRPFTLTASESTAGTGTVTQATATAASSVNHWDSVDNWGGSAIPADSDVIYLDFSDTSLLYGLGQSAIEPAAMYVSQSFTGQIGLPEVNEDGGYTEYRQTYLEIGPAALQIGAGEGNGSGRIKINTTTDPVAITVLNTGSSSAEVPAFLWKGDEATNTLTMRSGSVGVAVFGGETATLAAFTVDGGELTLGAGVTLSGALVVNGGVVRIASKVDGSLTTRSGATVTIEGTADVDQLTIRGGTVVLNTNGTLGGNTVISEDGVLDLSRDSRALAGVTNRIDLYGTECRVLDPYNRLGATTFDLNQGAQLSQIVSGSNVSWTRGATA